MSKLEVQANSPPAQVSPKVQAKIDPPTPFDPSIDDFEIWLKRFQTYLRITEPELAVTSEQNQLERKRDLLCGLLSRHVYTSVRNHCLPKEVESLPYRDLVDQIKDLYVKPVSEFTEMFSFFQLCQQNLSAQEFADLIREKASRCEFGAFYEKACSVAFTMGLNDQRMKVKLLQLEKSTSEKITLQICLNQVLSHEIVQREAQRVSRTFRTEDLNVLTENKECKNCGFEHKRSCPAKNAECRICSKIGHFARKCPEARDEETDDSETEGNLKDKRKESQQSIQTRDRYLRKKKFEEPVHQIY
uniref:CCHC-type domain-containing protein n=1 Tax=Acrobeloides nanus TaxID=290746 RepID=A0A914E3S7_9BILA